MAKKSAETKSFKRKPRVKRPGRHSKKKTSGLKSSKNYKKLSKGQG